MNTFDRNGMPISHEQANLLHRSADYVRVGQTTVIDAANGDTCTVSTVWLGADCFGIESGGPPIIFETLVFGDEEMPEFSRRYCLEAEAIAGHTEVVVEVAAAMTDPIVTSLPERAS